MLEYVLIILLGVNPSTGQQEVIVRNTQSLEQCEQILTAANERFSEELKELGGIVAGCFVQR